MAAGLLRRYSAHSPHSEPPPMSRPTFAAAAPTLVSLMERPCPRGCRHHPRRRRRRRQRRQRRQCLSPSPQRRWRSPRPPLRCCLGRRSPASSLACSHLYALIAVRWSVWPRHAGSRWIRPPRRCCRRLQGPVCAPYSSAAACMVLARSESAGSTSAVWAPAADACSARTRPPRRCCR